MATKPPRDELTANRDYWSRFLSFMPRGYGLAAFSGRQTASYSNGMESFTLTNVHAQLIEQAEEKALDQGYEQGYEDAMVKARGISRAEYRHKRN